MSCMYEQENAESLVARILAFFSSQKLHAHPTNQIISLH